MVKSHSNMTCPAYTDVEAASRGPCVRSCIAGRGVACAFCLIQLTLLRPAEALPVGSGREVDDFDVGDVGQQLSRPLRGRHAQRVRNLVRTG